MVQLRVVLALAAFPLCACSSDAAADGDDAAKGDAAPACSTTKNVSDGKQTDDDIAASATVLICYYGQPNEGYCRKITKSSDLEAYAQAKDKGAIGCKDATVLAGPECPTTNAVGRCTASTIDAERVYYTCSKFDDPASNCTQAQGTYTAL